MVATHEAHVMPVMASCTVAVDDATAVPELAAIAAGVTGLAATGATPLCCSLLGKSVIACLRVLLREDSRLSLLSAGSA